MILIRTVLEEFEDMYPQLFESGVEYYEYLDDDRVLVTFRNKDSWVYDTARPSNKLMRVIVIDDPSEFDQEDWQMGFGYLLERQMEIKQITRKQLAAVTKDSVGNISRYINGVLSPSMWKVFLMAEMLNCEFSDLIPDHIIPYY